ncbi:Slc25a24 [Scenedesmus sp. PABB004]|nr:Slc25a24 [Scenedesmus sp. PABB004]
MLGGLGYGMGMEAGHAAAQRPPWAGGGQRSGGSSSTGGAERGGSGGGGGGGGTVVLQYHALSAPVNVAQQDDDARHAASRSRGDDDEDVGDPWRVPKFFFAGGLAGAISRTATAPVDRLKMLLQVQEGQRLTIREGMRLMSAEGSVRSYFKGNGTNVLKIAPETSIKLALNDHLRHALQRDHADITPWERMVCGGVSGAVGQGLVYPLDTVRTRLAVCSAAEYRGILPTAAELWRAGGVAPFYRGLVPSMCGILPYAGVDICLFELLKDRLLEAYDGEPPHIGIVATGMASSSIAQFVSYPLALVRTRLQAQGTLVHEGVKGFYKGLLPNLIKLAPAAGISWRPACPPQLPIVPPELGRTLRCLSPCTCALGMCCGPLLELLRRLLRALCGGRGGARQRRSTADDDAAAQQRLLGPGAQPSSGGAGGAAAPPDVGVQPAALGAGAAAPTGPTTIIVMRHGHRQDEEDPCWSQAAARPWDPPLSVKGRVQANAAFEHLADYAVDAVLTSPFRRCLQTSAGLVKQLETPAGRWLADWQLAEICDPRVLFANRHDARDAAGRAGVATWMWGGLALDAALEKFVRDDCKLSKLAVSPRARPGSAPPPFPERLEQGLARYAAALTEIARSYAGQTVLVVTHGECVRAAVLLAEPQSEVFEVKHTGFVVLQRQPADGGAAADADAGSGWRLASASGETGGAWLSPRRGRGAPALSAVATGARHTPAASADGGGARVAGGLPAELWVCVLAELPLAERLGVAALVCSTWRAAADAATTSVEVKAAEQQRLDRLCAWLARRAGQLTRLSVAPSLGWSCDRCPTLALPCQRLARLEELQLDWLKLETPDGGGLAPLAGRLSSLVLRCFLPAPVLESLRALSGLRRLELQNRWGKAAVGVDVGVGAALDELTQLTALKLIGEVITTAAIAPISGLAQLRELVLERWQATTAKLVPKLPLRLMAAESGDGAALLRAVGACTALSALSMRSMDCMPLPAAACGHLAALSGRLVEMALLGGLKPIAVAPGAGAQLFPTGRTWSRLERLELAFDVPRHPDPDALRAACQADVDSLFAACPGLQSQCLQYAGRLRGGSVSVRGLRTLTPLTRLEFSVYGNVLSLLGDGLRTELAQLLALEVLIMSTDVGLTYRSVLHLTALRTLRRLEVHGCSYDDEHEEVASIEINNKVMRGGAPSAAGGGGWVPSASLCRPAHPAAPLAHARSRAWPQAPPGCAPDVWLQLQQVCAARCVECAKLVQEQRAEAAE